MYKILYVYIIYVYMCIHTRTHISYYIYTHITCIYAQVSFSLANTTPVSHALGTGCKTLWKGWIDT